MGRDGNLIDAHRYTPRGEASERRVRRDLETIVEDFSRHCEGTYVLTGSFGRGEGSVERTTDGRVPINDYDLIVVPDDGESCNEALLEGRANALAKELGIDFVDVMVTSRSDLERCDPSIFNYDLKYGSVPIYGDADILSLVPAFEPADIPVYEAVVLLSNRSAGLLGGLCNDCSSEYLENQLTKLALAWTDSLILSHERFDTTYREKYSLLEQLQTEGTLAGLSRAAEVCDLAGEALTRKYEPERTLEISSETVEHYATLTAAVFTYVLEAEFDREINGIGPALAHLATARRQPKQLAWNVYRLTRSDRVTTRTLVRCLPYLSEDSVRASVSAGLFRTLETDFAVGRTTLLERIGPHGDDAKARAIYDLWDVLYH